MNETTFENARVGDRVWSSEYGWGKIEVVCLEGDIQVSFMRGEECFYHWYLSLGISIGENTARTLFWDEIKFEAPPRPKRKVKKVLEGWINIYVYETGAFMFPNIYDTKKEALKSRGYLKPVGNPLFIRHEYEVEE